MKQTTIDLLKSKETDWERQNQVLASIEEIEAFEKENEKIHPSYIPFLRELGYETVGAEYFDRIEELKENLTKAKPYREDESTGKMKECFIFHWDGSGNPVGISWRDNKIYVDDDVFGNGMLLNESIDDYITELLTDD